MYFYFKNYKEDGLFLKSVVVVLWYGQGVPIARAMTEEKQGFLTHFIWFSPSSMYGKA